MVKLQSNKKPSWSNN